MTTTDEWVRGRAELAVSNAECGAQLEIEDEELRDSFVRNIIPAIHEAIERTRAEERANAEQALRLAHEMQDKAVAAAEKRGYDVGKTVARTEVRARLENPDEALCQKVLDAIGGGDPDAWMDEYRPLCGSQIDGSFDVPAICRALARTLTETDK